MSKKDFEERISTCYPYVRDLYRKYESVFSDDLKSLSWYPGWSHIVEGMLRELERDNKNRKVKTEIVHIKSHFYSLYVHYYSEGNRHADLIECADLACRCSCRACGDLIKLGGLYCEQCR